MSAPQLTPFARAVERLRPPVPKDWNDALLADLAGLRRMITDVSLVGGPLENDALTSVPAARQVRPELLPASSDRQANLLALAEAAGWPRVEWNTHDIGPGPDAWQERVPRLNALYVVVYTTVVRQAVGVGDDEGTAPEVVVLPEREGLLQQA